MNVFALELWHDLRQKKLWPVAAALVLALIAVPIFMLRDSSAGERPPAALPDSGASLSPVGVPAHVEDAANHSSSRLDVFGKKDPFKRPSQRLSEKPIQQAVKALVGGVQSLLGSAAQAAGSSLSGTSGDPFSSLSSTSSSPFGGSSSGGSVSGSSPSSGTPTSPTPGSGTSTTSDPKRPGAFSYRVDLRFGADEVRDHKGVKRLTPLPGADRPYLVFLGVGEDGKTATFLVDTAKFPRSAGEGECKPTPERCTLLSLTTDPDSDTHSFTDPEGKRYALRLTDINLEPVKETSSTTGARAKSARAARAERVSAARAERSEAKDGEGSKSDEDDGFAFTDFFDLFRERR